MAEIWGNEQLKSQLKDVGRRINLLRKERGLTLEKVSQQTGLSSPLLSQIEKGHINLSIANLWKIAQALGVEIEYFFQQHGPGDEVELTRADEREMFRLSHIMPEYPGYSYKPLASLNPQGSVEIFTVEVEALSPQEVKFNTHVGIEFTLILQGDIEFQFKGKNDYQTLLYPGDSLRFRAEYPHAYRSLREKGKMLTLLYSPLDRIARERIGTDGLI